MTTPSTSGQSDTSLTRDLIYAARYYLGRPRVLISLAAIAIGAGLAFNWSWLVAAGLAPILLSVLPCLIMCGVGVCMMCRSEKEQSAPVRDVAQVRTPSTAAAIDNSSADAGLSGSLPDLVEPTTPAQLGAVPVDPSGAAAGCCQGTGEAKPPQAVDLQPSEERKVSDA